VGDDASPIRALPLAGRRCAAGPCADLAGNLLTVAIDARAGTKLSYYLLWEKGGALVRPSFPSTETGDFRFSEPIDPAAADGLVLIISGRNTGGEYRLKATVAPATAERRP
jgi:hypothetical protein